MPHLCAFPVPEFSIKALLMETFIDDLLKLPV